ncbi:Vms1/Ankzf1 family peptidyl-tRNA hydrolase [Saccharopolyspora griseoalba]|uniref:Vms1/Ankzf1 family peptidyl-tRNA hydrolase n=1 Tax=Saccharopolyspora griseoalba TaxID=1431848 RepID=A0ABW2LNA5_9PSEU
MGSLQHVYDRPGPFVTAYLDTSADAEDASKAIELRWRDLRERLSGQGADEATLEAIGEHVRGHRAQTGQRGQVIVGTGGAVVLSDELPEPPNDLPAEDQAHFGPAPHLMPYLRRAMSRVPFVVAVLDRVGAELTLVRGPGDVERTEVSGQDHPVHKTHAGDPENHDRFHQAVEEQWRRNAEVIADEVTERARKMNARVIVLAGDVQQRGLVRERLGNQVRDTVLETDSGLHDVPVEQVRQEVAPTVHRAHLTEVVEEFERERGRAERAVEGWPDTVDRLRRGQVRTLLWTADDRAGELYIGPGQAEIADVEQDLADMGSETLDRVPGSAAVLRTLAAVDGEVLVAEPEAVELTGGIGAVLRYA